MQELSPDKRFGPQAVKMPPKALQVIQNNGRNYNLIGNYMYNSEDVIGQGAFGKVYKGVAVHAKKADISVAIKTMEWHKNEDTQMIEAIRDELKILNELKKTYHPHIIRFYDAKLVNKTVFIIMELCNEKSLSEYLKQYTEITEKEILYLFGQILEGFRHLKKLKIIHRDIKPENILMKNNILKIADFGFAKEYNQTNNQFHSFMGTVATVAPEVIQGNYSDECDIWSLGATLYFMCFKKYPYNNFFYNSLPKLLELMKQDKVEFPKKGMQISDGLKEMIVQLLRFDPKKRISWEELFNSQLFSLQALKQGGLNYFAAEEDIEISTEDMQEDLELNMFLKEVSEKDLREIEDKAGDIIKEAGIQQKNDEIKQKIIQRITFEKGKSKFLSLLAYKLQEFENIVANKLFYEKQRVDLFDHIKALKFGLSKYEQIISRGIIEWLSIKPDPMYYMCKDGNDIGVNQADWETFLATTQDAGKIQKVIQREMDIDHDCVYKHYKSTLIQLKQINAQACDRMQISQEYLSDNFHIEQKFFVTLFNLCIGLCKLLYPELVRIRNNLDQLHKVLNTLTLIDELLILTALDSTFIYCQDDQINFNAFFEMRKTNFSQDQQFYKVMYHRVMRAYEVFFE